MNIWGAPLSVDETKERSSQLFGDRNGLANAILDLPYKIGNRLKNDGESFDFNDFQKTGATQERPRKENSEDFLLSGLGGILLRPGPSMINKESQPWGGNPNKSGGQSVSSDNSLEFLRKGLMISSLYGSSSREALRWAKQQFGRDRKGNALDFPEMTKAARGKIYDHLNDDFTARWIDPIRARFGAWSLGMVDHDEFLDELFNQRGRLIDSLLGAEGVDSNVLERLQEKIIGEHSTYSDLIKNWAAKPGNSEKNKVATTDDEYRRRAVFPFTEDGQFNRNTVGDAPNMIRPVFRSNFGRRALDNSGYGA